MAANVHNFGEIGRTLAIVGAIVAFVIVMLTWVPDWISPEGTNGTGNRTDGGGVGRTTRMIQ